MILSDDILGKNPASWPKFLAGAILLPLCYFAFTILLGIGIAALIYANIFPPTLLQEFSDPEGPSSAGALFGMFLALGVFHIFLWVYLKIAYQRSYASLINPLGQDWRTQFFRGTIYIFAVLLISEIIGWILPLGESQVEYVWKPRTWFIWIVPMAIAIFLQSSAEEVFFRGFMQQYLARLIARKWVYYLVPTVFWAILHIGNVEGIWLNTSFIISIIIMGLVFADWVDRTGSLVGPIAAHFVNNFLLVCFYGNSLEPSELHIWAHNMSDIPDQTIAIFVMFSSVIIGAVYFLRRDYWAPRFSANA